MNVDRPQRGVEWDAAVEGETNSVQDWERIVSEWHPVNRQLARILASLDGSKRAEVAKDFSKIPGESDESYMQFITNLAFLSDDAFKKIKNALDETEKG